MKRGEYGSTWSGGGGTRGGGGARCGTRGGTRGGARGGTRGGKQCGARGGGGGDLGGAKKLQSAKEVRLDYLAQAGSVSDTPRDKKQKKKQKTMHLSCLKKKYAKFWNSPFQFL